MSGSNKDPIPTHVTLLVLFLALLWGGNAVALKFGLQEFGPLASAGLRFAVALILIAIWGRSNGTRLCPSHEELVPLFLLGLLFAFQIACFNWGTQRTHAARASVMLNTYPLFVALLAHFMVPDDKLTRWKTIGLILAFGGILFVFRDSLGGNGNLTGDLITLSSGFQLGLLIVLTNRLVQRIDSARLLVAEMAVGVPIFFGLSLLFEGRAAYGFSYPAAAGLLYQGIVVGGFCFVVWTGLLKRYSPSHMSVLFFTTPLWGMGLSHLLLHEPITFDLVVGAALVALGIYAVHASGASAGRES